MSILLLSEVFPPQVGGSSRYLWELYRRLPRERYFVVAGDHPGQEAFDGTHDIDVCRFPLSFPTSLLEAGGWGGYRRVLRALRLLLQQRRVSCVHAARAVPEGMIAAALKRMTGVNYVCSAHGEEINLSNTEVAPSWYRRRVFDSRELALETALVVRDASLMIASSHNTGDILRTRWRVPDENVAVVLAGVDTDRFRPASRDAAVRARLGWDERPVVLSCGRLIKRKGHDVLISALARIRRQIPELLCSIVGDGEERQALESLVEEKQLADQVQFLGELSDERLLECYQQCDLFVLANRQIGGDLEGLGMVLLEAQACGRPVVAGDSGGTRETMQVPDTGMVVPCDGPDQLGAQIAELLANPAKLDDMGRAGRRWTVERFGWAARSEQLDALLRASPFSAGGHVGPQISPL